MIRFVGGDDGMVVVIDGDGAHILGHHSWADENGCAKLVEDILGWLLEDSIRANKLHRRVMKRMISEFDKTRAWTLTDAQINPIVEDIERIWRESMKDIHRMSVEPPRGAASMGGIADTSQWGGTSHQNSNAPPTLKPNR